MVAGVRAIRVPCSLGLPDACLDHGRLVGSREFRPILRGSAAMTISNHLEHFAGFPVKDYDTQVGIVGEQIPRREYQFVEGSSQKFWAIELVGTKHIVQFGRIGTAGQTQTKEFKTPEEAQNAFD